MLITLQKNDPRLGVLTWEGQYRWPAVNIANLGYQIPNVQPRYIDEKPDDRGSRWFVILCPGYFDAEVHVGDLTTVPVSTLTDLEGIVETHEVTFDAAQPTAIEATSDPELPVVEVAEKPVSKARGKGKGSK